MQSAQVLTKAYQERHFDSVATPTFFSVTTNTMTGSPLTGYVIFDVPESVFQGFSRPVGLYKITYNLEV